MGKRIRKNKRNISKHIKTKNKRHFAKNKNIAPKSEMWNK